jgi:hypothetical protein
MSQLYQSLSLIVFSLALSFITSKMVTMLDPAGAQNLFGDGIYDNSGFQKMFAIEYSTFLGILEGFVIDPRELLLVLLPLPLELCVIFRAIKYGRR